MWSPRMNFCRQESQESRQSKMHKKRRIPGGAQRTLDGMVGHEPGSCQRKQGETGQPASLACHCRPWPSLLASWLMRPGRRECSRPCPGGCTVGLADYLFADPSTTRTKRPSRPAERQPPPPPRQAARYGAPRKRKSRKARQFGRSEMTLPRREELQLQPSRRWHVCRQGWRRQRRQSLRKHSFCQRNVSGRCEDVREGITS